MKSKGREEVVDYAWKLWGRIRRCSQQRVNQLLWRYRSKRHRALRARTFWQESDPTFPAIADAFGAHVDRCEWVVELGGSVEWKEVRVWVVSFGVSFQITPASDPATTPRPWNRPPITRRIDVGERYIECFDELFVMVLKTLGLESGRITTPDFRRPRISGGTVLTTWLIASKSESLRNIT